MKKLLLLLVVCISFGSAYAESPLDNVPGLIKVAEVGEAVTLQTTSFAEGISMPTIKGYMIGLSYAPSGDYRVDITNCPSLNTERFSLMTCKVDKYLANIGEVIDSPDTAMLSTAFTVGSTVYNKIGYFSGCRAYPSDDYQVVITNGKDVRFWNSLKCRIK